MVGLRQATDVANLVRTGTVRVAAKRPERHTNFATRNNVLKNLYSV